ncbi:aspartate aminotransferase family protein, partial [Streptomyces sp. SID4944]|nr:aspartate aminotransferase family protein [Streptomyces sp. SID4944]
MSSGTGDLLAGGADGPGRLRALTSVVLDTLETAARARGGPLPAGGPNAVARRTAALCDAVLPEEGVGAEAALADLVRAVAEG